MTRNSVRVAIAVAAFALSIAPARAPAMDQDMTTARVSCDEAGFDEIVFVKRKPYSSDHYYTDINNGTSNDRFLAENGIYVYNLRTQQERTVVDASRMPGGKGFIGKISLSFDARKIVFDFRENPRSGFRIWEVNTDGTGLRQVSLPPADEKEKVARWGKAWHTDDIHPCYLPDGDIIFSSTRCEHTILCGGSAALVAPVLHRMDADGTNIEQLTKSPVSEFCPVVLDDGRVMYHRWEYIDKGARVCKTIWSMNPDGTRPQELYGVADDTTTVYMYPQA
ncbi:MAG: TolB family protein, partial [Planctomycetota bacterium]